VSLAGRALWGQAFRSGFWSASVGTKLIFETCRDAGQAIVVSACCRQWSGCRSETEPLPRFKIFESNDTDESVDALNRFFGEQNSINRLSDEVNLTSISAGNVANSLLVHFRSTHELFIERKDTTDHVFVNIAPIEGRMQVARWTSGDVVTASETFGVIVSMDKSTKVVVSGYNGRGLLIPRSTIHDQLVSLIGKRAAVPVEFDMTLDTGNGGGNLIHSSIDMAAQQLEHAQSPLSRPAVAARLEEFIINALLHGQPHSYLDAIIGERRPAAPKQVRRAEEYIHAHAGEVVKLSQIAEAAGCSVRALQLAFRTFRDTTPMTLLRQARLERAHAELSQSDPGATTVTKIAVKYGFFNVGRFARDYRSAFGQSPSETLRRQSARPRMK
jgi:AraC-like DNA-binding protein